MDEDLNVLEQDVSGNNFMTPSVLLLCHKNKKILSWMTVAVFYKLGLAKWFQTVVGLMKSHTDLPPRRWCQPVNWLVGWFVGLVASWLAGSYKILSCTIWIMVKPERWKLQMQNGWTLKKITKHWKLVIFSRFLCFQYMLLLGWLIDWVRCFISSRVKFSHRVLAVIF